MACRRSQRETPRRAMVFSGGVGLGAGLGTWSIPGTVSLEKPSSIFSPIARDSPKKRLRPSSVNVETASGHAPEAENEYD